MVTPSPTDSTIFEDQSDDYAGVGHSPIPPTPSIISLIEAKLPLHLPQPSCFDASIFEDISDNHFNNDYATTTTPSHRQPVSVVQVVLHLVSAGDYDKAYEYCTEMTSAGIELPKSDIYEAPASAAIAQQSTLSEEAIQAIFIYWVDLLPSIHELEKPRVYQRLKRQVFQTLRSTVTLAIQFSLVMAAKGYANSLAAESISHIMRFASPPVALRFLADFREAGYIYLNSLERPDGCQHTLDEEVAQRKEELAYLIRNLAIDSLTSQEDFESALSLLPTPENPFRLPTAIYDILLTRMRVSRFGKPDDISRVEQLLVDPRYCDTRKFRSESTTTERDHQHLAVLDKARDPESHEYIGEVLASQLEAVVDQILTSDLSPSLLSEFLSGYYNTGRNTVVPHLRQLATHRNKVTAGIFLYAEMAYHYNHGHDLLVLRLFANHLYFSGVPENEVLNAISYLEGSGKDDRGHPTYHVHPIHQQPSKRKVWPTRSHSDLAWLTLLKLQPIGRRFEQFYNTFIQFQTSHKTPATPAATRFGPPRPPMFPSGGAVFTAFTRKFLEGTSQPEHGATAFRTMLEMGFHPTIHHYTIMIEFYIRRKDIRRAFYLVEALESAHPVKAPQDMHKALEDRHNWRAVPGTPPPDVIYYAALIARFTRSKYLQEALDIKTLFHRRFKYVKGVHKPLDVAFQHLRRIKHENLTQVYLK
ncbi:hypothetical protein DXG01_015007 [Tephrocybe rancida]|nr:hypothetical protein DXG01_015007 [Tephrocybe rancida]